MKVEQPLLGHVPCHQNFFECRLLNTICLHDKAAFNLAKSSVLSDEYFKIFLAVISFDRNSKVRPC